MATPTTILWTRSQDAESRIVRNLLNRLDITFEERDLSTAKWKWADVVAAIPTAKNVPQLVLNGTLVGDYDAIMNDAALKVTKEKYAESVKKFLNS